MNEVWRDPAAVRFYDEAPFPEALSAPAEAFGASTTPVDVPDLAALAAVGVSSDTDVYLATGVDVRADRPPLSMAPPPPPSAPAPVAAPAPAPVAWLPMSPRGPAPTVPWNPPVRTPPRPGRRRTRSGSLSFVPVLIIAGIVVFLANGGVGLIRDLVDRDDVPSGATTAVTSYYDAAAAGEVETAAGWVCGDRVDTWRADQTLPTGDTMRIAPFDEIVNSAQAGSGWDVVARVELRDTDADPAKVTVHVVEESGGYRVCEGVQ